MLEGYFDESYRLEGGSRTFVVAGYFLSTEAAKKMDQEWHDVLKRYEIPYFHMVDCAHGTGVFKNKTKEERVEIEKKCIRLIKRYRSEGFAALAHEDTYSPLSRGEDLYGEFADMAVVALLQFLHVYRIQSDTAFFFESGHHSEQSASTRVANRIEQPLSFGTKEQLRLLQAADLLAWQARKYIQDVRSGRDPRKDFLSLIEHHHTFFHVRDDTGQKTLGVEVWPISKRSYTAQLETDDSGPITLVREEGEGKPLIMVGETGGHRVGMGRMAYVAMKDIMNNEFALAFDEPRLHEAIQALMFATGLYPNSDLVPMMPIEDIELMEATDEEVVLAVRIVGGAHLGLKVSRDSLRSIMGEVENS